jgi:hypothetical protein
MTLRRRDLRAVLGRVKGTRCAPVLRTALDPSCARRVFELGRGGETALLTKQGNGKE